MTGSPTHDTDRKLAELHNAEITIVKSSSVDQRQLSDFYHRVFPDRAPWLSRYWRWWYRVGYVPAIEPLVGVARGVVLAHIGLMPFHFLYLGKLETGIWPMDLAVLPEAAKLRLGTRLARAVSESHYHQLGHGNDASYSLFVKRNGWLLKKDVFRCALAIHPGKLAKTRGQPRFVRAWSGVSPLVRVLLAARSAFAPKLCSQAIPHEPSALLPLFRSRTSQIELIRDEDWIRWRILESPFRSDLCLFLYEGAGAILRSAVSSGVKRAHILWFNGSGEARVARRLLHGIVAWTIREGFDLLWTVNSDRWFLQLSKLFLPSRRAIIFGSHSSNPDVERALAYDPYALQAIDCDFDLMTVPTQLM